MGDVKTTSSWKCASTASTSWAFHAATQSALNERGSGSAHRSSVPPRVRPVPGCGGHRTRLASVVVLDHLSESPAGSSDPDERPLLGDRYRLDGVLGRGGMATVHRAHDVLLERDVAVKVFPAVLHGTDDLLRNRAEIRVLATLSHPGLVTLHDAGTVHGDDGSEQVYLVMELVEGPTLAERLRQGRWTSSRPHASAGTSPRRSRPCTSGTSCTATSSPPTCC